MATRDWVNQLAGSKRMLGHGQLYTGVGNLWFIEEQIEELKPDSWKGYNIATAAKLDDDPNSLMVRWTLDDPVVAYPTYAKIDDQGQRRAATQHDDARCRSRRAVTRSENGRPAGNLE